MDAKEMSKVVGQLTYDLRTNMTSVTRFVRMEKEKHPTLTEGQYLDRYLEYKKLALEAVENILKCLNDNEKLREVERAAYEKENDMKLYAFWKNDTPPYLIGGEVDRILEDGYVVAKNFGGYKFNPVKIVPLDIGLELKEKLNKAYNEYETARNRALDDLKQVVKEISD